METSVAVAVHKNHNQQFDSFESGSFLGINCRTFETGLVLYHSCTDDGKKLSFAQSPKTPVSSSSLKNSRKKAMSVPIKINLHGANYRAFESEVSLLPTPLESHSFSPISPRVIYNDDGFEKCIRNAKEHAPSFSGRLDFGQNRVRFSERWAGPAYTNSPAPSSLPLPKFSLRAKRIVSLDLPSLSSDIDLHRIAKSAPASPTRRSLTCEILDNAADPASKSLRRILNLDE